MSEKKPSGKRVYLPGELYAELQAQAEKYGLSVDQWANQLLEEERDRIEGKRIGGIEK